MNKAVNRATRAINTADVAVYPVDIRGSGARVEPYDSHRHHHKGERRPRPCSRRWRTCRPNQDTMRAIAEATGGRVYLNTNAIGDAIRHAIDDSRVSYVLGYRSSRPDNDNKFRNIAVKVESRRRRAASSQGLPGAPAARARLHGRGWRRSSA